MSMLYPKFEIKIDEISFTPETSNSLISIKVNSEIDSPDCSFNALFRLDSNNINHFKNKHDSIVSVSLGYSDKLDLVFSGFLDSFNLEFDTITISCLGSLSKLTRFSSNKFYEKKTSGQIVKELLTDAGNIETDIISDGILFPYYAIDDNKNAYEHIQELAYLSGFDFYCNSQNKCVFKHKDFAMSQEKKHSLEYSKHIISMIKIIPLDIYKTVKVYGESPASIKGEDTSHWISKNAITKEFTNTDPESKGIRTFTVYNRAIKDEKTCEQIAKNIMNEKIMPKNQLNVECIGLPKIKIGDYVTLKNTPIDNLSSHFQVRKLSHIYNINSGFMTSLHGVELSFELE